MSTETLATKTTEGAAPEQTRGGWNYRRNAAIVESAEEMAVLADTPGAQADEVDVHFERGSLTIHAKIAERQSDRVKDLLREYGVGNFHRTFQVSEAIDVSRISAEHADGVLVL